MIPVSQAPKMQLLLVETLICTPLNMYSTELFVVQPRAFLRESKLREIALSVWRARRFSRNLAFTNQLGTVYMCMHELSRQIG